MSSKSRPKKSKSVCETSMEMVANFIKASSLSLAQISLGSSTVESPPSSKRSELVEKEPLVPGSRKLRKRKGNPNRTYVIALDNTTQVLQEVKDVDGMATKFIDKVHRSFEN